ncbi:MAG: hypothetical protein QM698_08525 [Micropepsaceae bacterium]
MSKGSQKAATIMAWGKDLSMHHRLKRATEAMMRNKGGTDRSWGIARGELLPLRPADFPKTYQADFAAIQSLWGTAVFTAGKTTLLRPSTFSPRQRDEITERLLRLFAAQCAARGKYA